MKHVKKGKVLIDTLVLDFNIYPRHSISDVTAADYSNSLKAECIFPPIVVDMNSLRVVDGFHRVKAHRTNKIKEIEAEFYKFDDEKDILLAAMRFNSIHGLRITSYDRARCLVLGQQFGINEQEITAALHITKPKYDKIATTKIRHIEIKKIGQKSSSKKLFEPVPVKRIVSDITERTVTKKIIDAQKTIGGLSAIYYINQTAIIIKNNLVKNDKESAEIIHKLANICQQWLGRMEKAA